MPETLTLLAAGLGTGLSLIVAIGTQNAFVLRQGLRREHVLPVVAVCGLSDAVLIAAGIAGIGGLLALWPGALAVVSWVGALFLGGYGLLAARRALRPGPMTTGAGTTASPRTAVLTCLALTWLNPHVYLDTVLLLGAVGNGYGEGRWIFAAGAVLGSAGWFGALGFGARSLSGLFARRAAWRVLDGLIAVTMITLGVALAVRASA